MTKPGKAYRGQEAEVVVVMGRVVAAVVPPHTTKVHYHTCAQPAQPRILVFGKQVTGNIVGAYIRTSYMRELVLRSTLKEQIAPSYPHLMTQTVPRLHRPIRPYRERQE